eukprot:CAMPEP_0197844064 /NCGR_PEP_ID=MMETSP1438-20131217/1037_1 /TAXON_ID=1461541 /ORGANISM="Pterosperma sp., Strain CCMP1384" /LENGTH=411 /DNA_ID=CAMNT_0043454625 /DNA_START=44 /DNA_END=1279 /DNA_ORIENTATION=+
MSKSSTTETWDESEDHEGFWIGVKTSDLNSPIEVWFYPSNAINFVGFELSIKVVGSEGDNTPITEGPNINTGEWCVGCGWNLIEPDEISEFMLKTKQQASTTGGAQESKGADSAEESEESEDSKVSIGTFFYRGRVTQYNRQVKALFNYVLPHARAVSLSSEELNEYKSSEFCSAIVLAISKLHSNEYLSGLLIPKLMANNFLHVAKQLHCEEVARPTLLSLSSELLKQIITQTSLRTDEDEMNVLKCIITWARHVDIIVGSRVTIIDEDHPDKGRECKVVKRPQGKYEVTGTFSSGANLVLKKSQLSSPGLVGFLELLPCVRFPYIQPIKRIAEELTQEEREFVKEVPLFTKLVKEAATIQLSDGSSVLGKRVREEAGDRVAKRLSYKPIEALDSSSAGAWLVETMMSHM